MTPTRPPADFLALSARLGRDPLQVQGPGGNTSFKMDGAMWIKASGAELADAERTPTFVAVDLEAARAEAHGEGDGTCKSAVMDPAATLRPSIETTFHALLDWPVVAHTHSIAAIVHAIAPDGIAAARDKLHDLDVAVTEYRKPGLDLTRAIAAAITPRTQVILLANHGLVVAGDSVAAVDALCREVETRLTMPVLIEAPDPVGTGPDGFDWLASATALATEDRLMTLATIGSYYPDHVVFLGPALSVTDNPASPAILVPGSGAALRHGATASQAAMLTCLADILTRLPPDWTPTPIGADAERALLDWDAEKYRQALAMRGR